MRRSTITPETKLPDAECARLSLPSGAIVARMIVSHPELGRVIDAQNDDSRGRICRLAPRTDRPRQRGYG